MKLELDQNQRPIQVGLVIESGWQLSTILNVHGTLETLATKEGEESITVTGTIAGMIVKQRGEVGAIVQNRKDWDTVNEAIRRAEWTTLEGDERESKRVRLWQAMRIATSLTGDTNRPIFAASYEVGVEIIEAIRRIKEHEKLDVGL